MGLKLPATLENPNFAIMARRMRGALQCGEPVLARAGLPCLGPGCLDQQWASCPPLFDCYRISEFYRICDDGPPLITARASRPPLLLFLCTRYLQMQESIAHAQTGGLFGGSAAAVFE